MRFKTFKLVNTVSTQLDLGSIRPLYTYDFGFMENCALTIVVHNNKPINIVRNFTFERFLETSWERKLFSQKEE